MPTRVRAQERRSGTVIVVAALALGLVGCRGSTPKPLSVDGPEPSPSATGAVPVDRLEAMLLQTDDLPGLGRRRAFAGAGLTTQSTPQLSLCRAARDVAPHQLANVIAQVIQPGGVKVFEVLSVFADEAAAKAAYDKDVADAKACSRYASDGVAHRVAELGPVDLGPEVEAVHYALITSDVVSGDIRTYARRGATTLLISGFGAPPTKQPLLDYQAELMRKALARLG